MQEDLKTRVIDAIKATNSWCVNDCVKLFEASDDPTKVVIPASMPHMLPVVNAVLSGGQ